MHAGNRVMVCGYHYMVKKTFNVPGYHETFPYNEKAGQT